jgi:NAD(P)-dependent dehydrogenase (short-subunit alcohol dehydrogenase family)
MGRLDNKVAIITGAASGMGAAAGRLFAQEGAKVVLGDINEPLLETVIKEIKEKGGDAISVKLNVASEENWKEIVKKTVDTYGKIDILVNNAGIITGKGLEETDVDNWNKVMSIDGMSTFLGMKYVVPEMKKNGKGSIVNNSSVAALVGGPGSNGKDITYSAAKGAIRSMTKHIANTYAEYNIRVNSIHPGSIKTPLWGDIDQSFIDSLASLQPLPPHYGQPEDVAYAMLFLASDESRFITGIELPVDGGFVSR